MQNGDIVMFKGFETLSTAEAAAVNGSNLRKSIYDLPFGRMGRSNPGVSVLHVSNPFALFSCRRKHEKENLHFQKYRRPETCSTICQPTRFTRPETSSRPTCARPWWHHAGKHSISAGANAATIARTHAPFSLNGSSNNSKSGSNGLLSCSKADINPAPSTQKTPFALISERILKNVRFTFDVCTFLLSPDAAGRRGKTACRLQPEVQKRLQILR